MSSSVVLDWLTAHRVDTTHPDGSRETTRPQVLPFDMIAPEVGCHAFDLSGLRTKGCASSTSMPSSSGSLRCTASWRHPSRGGLMGS